MQYMSLFEICFNYRRDVYVFYRIEFDLLYKLTFIGRKSAKHLIGSNHWFHEYVHNFQKLKIFTKICTTQSDKFLEKTR